MCYNATQAQETQRVELLRSSSALLVLSLLLNLQEDRAVALELDHAEIQISCAIGKKTRNCDLSLSDATALTKWLDGAQKSCGGVQSWLWCSGVKTRHVSSSSAFTRVAAWQLPYWVVVAWACGPNSNLMLWRNLCIHLLLVDMV